MLLDKFSLEKDMPESKPRTANKISDDLAGASHRLFGLLRAEILSGVYAAQERLPAERLLAERHETSRATVRRALAQLETEGLVRRRMGSGTFVADDVNHEAILSGDDVVKMTSPLELIDARMGIEVQMVRLAVVNANAHDIEALQRAAEFGSATTTVEEFSIADSLFHLAIADATQNPLIIWMYKQINDIRCHRQWSSMKDKVLNAQRIENYNRQHHDIVAAIAQRDQDLAVENMRRHMRDARLQLLGIN